MMRAVKDAGYTPMVEKVTIPVSGISCASCVATIEEALRRSPGVVSATVNFATNAATVADLRRTIRDAGYEPLEAAEGSALADHEKTAREREIRTLKRKLAAGIVLWTRCGSATEWWCGPGRRSRWTESCARAPRRWTSPCSPGKASRWRSGPGTG